MTLHRLLGGGRTVVAVSSQPRKSVAARRDRGGRDVDGVVDDDGAAAGGGAAGDTADSGRRPRPVGVGEAGAVLADLVEGMSGRDDIRVAALKTSHRFGESIGRLAAAIRDGDASRALDLLRAGDEHIEWIESDDLAGRTARSVAAARATGCGRPRCSVRRGRADDAGRAPVAVRAPARAVRGGALEPLRSAVADRGDRGSRCGRRGTRAGRCW